MRWCGSKSTKYFKSYETTHLRYGDLSLILPLCLHNEKKYWLAHTHPFNGPFSRTTQVGRYQKGETNLDFTKARASEWQWHQLGICKFAPRSRQNSHASTSPLSFLQAGCPSCRPTNSVKALKTQALKAQILTGTRWSYRLEYSGNYSGPQWPSAGFFCPIRL